MPRLRPAATLLLDRGIPVHVVADRIGDDPAVLLRNYSKRKRKITADNSVSAAITAGGPFSGNLKPWVNIGSSSQVVLDLPLAKCLLSLERKGGRVV